MKHARINRCASNPIRDKPIGIFQTGKGRTINVIPMKIPLSPILISLVFENLTDINPDKKRPMVIPK